MDKAELNEARTNPEFLNYLETTRVEAIENENIAGLYEVLDSMLILDLDEEKINGVYQNILKIAFERVENIVNDNKKLSLEGDELFYVRSFYEHAIEKWSYGNIDGAKELFFVLLNIISDEFLQEALKIHLIATSKGHDLDTFYEKKVDTNSMPTKEEYGYFIVNFKFEPAEFIETNKEILETEFKNLAHLLD